MNPLPHARQSLKTRITLATLAIFVAGLWSLSNYASLTLRQDMERQLGEQQLSVVTAIASDINQHLTDRIAALEAVAPSLLPAMRQSGAATQAILEQRQVLPILFNAGVFITDSAGTAIASIPTSSGRIGVNYLDRDFVVTVLKEGKVTIGRPVVGKKLRIPLFSIGVPIRNTQGKVIGVLAGTTNLGVPNFLDRITDRHYGKTGGYVLVAPQYRIVITATDRRRMMQPLPEPGVNPHIDRFIEHCDAYAIYRGVSDIEQLASCKRMPVSGWDVGATQPTDEALAPIRTMQKNMLLATLFLTLIAGGLTWWMLRRQLAPMTAAATTLSRMTDSDQPPQALPIVNHDEIGALVGGFNQLLETLAQREGALQLERDSSRNILATVEAMIVALDLEGRITLANRKACEILGYREDELIGQDWFVTCLPRSIDVDQVRGVFKQALAGQLAGSEYYENPVRTRSGGERLIAWHNSSIRDKNGNIIGGLSAGEDITERRHLEQALRESESLFREMFEQAPLPYQSLDIEGNILAINQAWLSQLGYEQHEVLGRFIGDFIAADSMPTLSSEFPKFKESGHVNGPLFEFKCKDGSLKFMEVNGRIHRDSTGNFQRTHCILSDVTLRKQLEDVMRQNRDHLEALVTKRTQELALARDAAETSNIAKSAFLANMSHEIRTPLNAITGLAYVLRRSGLTAQQIDKLDKIENAGTHLLNILNDVLDLSKIEAGKFVLDDAPVHVEALLGNIASMLGQKVQDKGLRMNIENTSLLRNLQGDPTRLQQALLNYASNAIKFTERGHITLRVKADAQTDETATLRFEVEDSGIGIGPEALPKLFSAFEQADNSTTRKYGGTGLGLAITKKIAEAMGGTAGATSSAGKGSTFWFTAVLRKARQTTEASDRAGSESAEQVIVREHANKLVLLAEDEPVNREIARMVLEYVGLRIDLAEDGRDAVEKARSGSYAAILMDIQMPVLDGLDATRQIRQLPGCKTTPILAMTANAFDEMKDQCLESGMDDFVAKPVMPEMLYETLLKWFEKRRG